jgi:signal transduction histidine kinase
MTAFVLFGLLVSVASMLSVVAADSVDSGLLAILLIAGLIVLGGWQVATHATRDIRRLATMVTDHGSEILSGRLPKCELFRNTQESKELCDAFLKFADRLGEMKVDLQDQIMTCERTVESSKQNLHNFMFRVAHTLRTPLNEIRWSAETLKNEEVGRLTTAQREILDTLERSTVDVLNRTGILQDTLAVLRGEKLRLKPRACEIIPLIEETLGNWAVPARRRRIRLVWTPPDGAPFPAVRCDTTRVLQVLDAVVGNAIRYTKPGRKVEVTVQRVDDPVPKHLETVLHLPATLRRSVVVAVHDQGIGIPEREHDSMFEPFYRASNASDLYVDGTGASLTLARAIIKSLGGQMWFVSKKGRGTTMYFSLPTA